jgi:aminomethyltransferase
MDETSIALETPLAALHKSAGATMGTWFGCELPDYWTNARDEQEFARKSVALVDENYRAYLSFTGPDRVRYLNAILTNNIKELGVGRGSLSLLLNPQGRILAEIETYALVESLLCVSHTMIRERLIEWLDKYIIMDDVTLADETARFGTLGIEGPEAAAVALEVAGLEISWSAGRLRWVQFPAGLRSGRLVEWRDASSCVSAKNWWSCGRCSWKV